MSQSLLHPNYVTPVFRSRYPTSSDLLRHLDEILRPATSGDFVSDRVLARFGADAIIGGCRAADFPREMLKSRGAADLDIGLLGHAADLLALSPNERFAAIDQLVRRCLSADLGDHVDLEPKCIEKGERGAYYLVKAWVDGEEVGRTALDVDCDPHITAPVKHSFSPLSDFEIPGLVAGMRTYQNSADIFAEKLLAVRQNAWNDSKPRYAKHLSDLIQMFKSKEFDPYYVAVSLKELARTSGVRLSQIYPLQYLNSASDRYRARRKKLTPGVKLPLHVMREDFGKLKSQLEPVVREAHGDDRHPVMTREEFATVIRDLWLPPVPPPRTNLPPVGSHPVPNAKVSPYRTHIVWPRSGPNHGAAPGGFPPGQRSSRTSRGR